MADETDGIEEALESTVRLAAITAARVGSEIARARQERLRHDQLSDDARTRQLTSRLQAERALGSSRVDAGQPGRPHLEPDHVDPPSTAGSRTLNAVELGDRGQHQGPDAVEERGSVEAYREAHNKAQLVAVHSDDWWARADADRIAELYNRAIQSPELAEAAAAENRIRDEVAARYGIQLNAAHQRNPRELMADITIAQQSSPGATREDRVALGLLSEAEIARARERQAREHAVTSTPSTSTYDSVERRAATAQGLERAGVEPEVVAVRMYADTGAGASATLATAGARRGKAPKARTPRGRRSAQIDRAGVER